ncbi:minor capsid protein [Aneurinibacillus thermoaerophilus]|uniref:minor capsid protein n=1 Tax=Aneurinibacillus thermoaerophilus TaxID=143495 RepID=UPI002E1FF498|nr:minor capsid protein [Aneurinibacillus thermoaerophilus]MED0680577.1 minor capsid protein [Aneurinibacillus thermoaerophilus]
MFGKVLKEHAVETFAHGQATGDVLVRELHKKYNRRKLADWQPTHRRTIRLADDDNEVPFWQQEDWFKPHEAIRALEARNLVLAGSWESDIITKTKQIAIQQLQGMPRKEAEKEIAELLRVNKNRAELIVTTETTYAYNRGRLSSFHANQVDYVQFSAVMDARTSQQCRSRHGLIMSMDDPRLPLNTPPLHGRCRSILVPIYSEYQPELITEKSLDWSKVKPLPKGWRPDGALPGKRKSAETVPVPQTFIKKEEKQVPEKPKPTESQHPVDQLIMKVINEKRQLTAEEIVLIQSHMKTAKFASRLVRTKPTILKLAAEMNIQAQGKKLPSDIVHWLKHAVYEQQWPKNTTLDDYLSDLQAASSDQNAHIMTYIYKTEPFIAFLSLAKEAGLNGEQFIYVVYSAKYGRITTGLKVDNVEKFLSQYTFEEFRKHR